MAETTINSRIYTCYSSECAGGVSGRDTDPKPHGVAATCWACGTDLYTMPRFGAPSDHIPEVKKIITYPKPVNAIGYGWAESFANLWAPRQDVGQRD